LKKKKIEKLPKLFPKTINNESPVNNNKGSLPTEIVDLTVNTA